MKQGSYIFRLLSFYFERSGLLSILRTNSLADGTVVRLIGDTQPRVPNLMSQCLAGAGLYTGSAIAAGRSDSPIHFPLRWHIFQFDIEYQLPRMNETAQGRMNQLVVVPYRSQARQLCPATLQDRCRVAENMLAVGIGERVDS